MKMKSLALGAAAMMLTASSVLADINLYITGSTAFRSAAYLSIRSLYSPGFAQNTEGSANNSGANRMTWSGIMPSVSASETVNVFASWSGSAAGVGSVTSGSGVTFFSSPTQGVTTTVSHAADATFSDVYQDTTGFTSPTLNDDIVGVVPFTFVRNQNASSVNLTNISHQQAITLLGNGTLSLRFFTGIAADQATSVVLVGRDAGSGTRQTVQADVGFGALTSSSLYKLIAGVWTGAGNAGYSSGSSVRNDLNNAVNNGPAIGYLGLGDAAGVNSGNNNIAYEGVMYSPTAVYEGTYSLWGYQHLMYGTLDAPKTSVKNAIVGAIPTNLGTTGLDASLMQVIRFSDGGAIGTVY